MRLMALLLLALPLPGQAAANELYATAFCYDKGLSKELLGSGAKRVALCNMQFTNQTDRPVVISRAKAVEILGWWKIPMVHDADARAAVAQMKKTGKLQTAKRLFSDFTFAGGIAASFVNPAIGAGIAIGGQFADRAGERADFRSVPSEANVQSVIDAGDLILLPAQTGWLRTFTTTAYVNETKETDRVKQDFFDLEGEALPAAPGAEQTGFNPEHPERQRIYVPVRISTGARHAVLAGPWDVVTELPGPPPGYLQFATGSPTAALRVASDRLGLPEPLEPGDAWVEAVLQ